MWRSVWLRGTRGWSSGSVRLLSSGFAEETVEAGKSFALQITDSCVQRLKQLAGSRSTKDVVLRVAVEGGGCSGFQYHFNLENSTDVKEDDQVFERDGARVVVDEVSMPFLVGAKVDYEEEMIRTSFKIVENPNSDTSCSCGVSFSAK